MLLVRKDGLEYSIIGTIDIERFHAAVPSFSGHMLLIL
jgi:hypothetical protein